MESAHLYQYLADREAALQAVRLPAADAAAGRPDRGIHRHRRPLCHCSHASRAPVQPHVCSGFTCCPPGCWRGLLPGRYWRASGCPSSSCSQLRYLGEPRTWCRLAPLAEKDEIVVVARVWRRDEPAPRSWRRSASSGCPAAARWPRRPRRSLLQPGLPPRIRRRRPPASRAGRRWPALSAAASAGRPLSAAGAVRTPEIPAWAVLAARRSGMSRPACRECAADRGPAPVVPAKPAAARGPAREPAPWPARGRRPAQPRAVPPSQERAPSHARHSAQAATTVPPAASAWPAAATVTPPTSLRHVAPPPAATAQPAGSPAVPPAELPSAALPPSATPPPPAAPPPAMPPSASPTAATARPAVPPAALPPATLPSASLPPAASGLPAPPAATPVTDPPTAAADRPAAADQRVKPALSVAPDRPVAADRPAVPGRQLSQPCQSRLTGQWRPTGQRLRSPWPRLSAPSRQRHHPCRRCRPCPLPGQNQPPGRRSLRPQWRPPSLFSPRECLPLPRPGRRRPLRPSPPCPRPRRPSPPCPSPRPRRPLTLRPNPRRPRLRQPALRP